MRADDADEFVGGDDFGFLPELWEMALIAGNQVVRAGGVGAFQENVIGGVGRDLKRAGGRHEMSPVFEEPKKLLPESFANMKFRAREHGTVLREDRRRQVEAGRPGNGQKKNGALQPAGLSAADATMLVSRTKRRGSIQSCSTWPVRPYFLALLFRKAFFFPRAALMMRSIWRDERDVVSLRRDSSPMARRTSGSGEASRT